MKVKNMILEAARWLAVVAAVVCLLIQFGGNAVSNAAFEDVLRSVMEKYSIDKPLVRSDMLDKPFY